MISNQDVFNQFINEVENLIQNQQQNIKISLHQIKLVYAYLNGLEVQQEQQSIQQYDQFIKVQTKLLQLIVQILNNKSQKELIDDNLLLIDCFIIINDAVLFYNQNNLNQLEELQIDNCLIRILDLFEQHFFQNSQQIDQKYQQIFDHIFQAINNYLATISKNGFKNFLKDNKDQIVLNYIYISYEQFCSSDSTLEKCVQKINYDFFKEMIKIGFQNLLQMSKFKTLNDIEKKLQMLQLYLQYMTNIDYEQVISLQSNQQIQYIHTAYYCYFSLVNMLDCQQQDQIRIIKMLIKYQFINKSLEIMYLMAINLKKQQQNDNYDDQELKYVNILINDIYQLVEVQCFFLHDLCNIIQILDDLSILISQNDQEIFYKLKPSDLLAMKFFLEEDERQLMHQYIYSFLSYLQGTNPNVFIQIYKENQLITLVLQQFTNESSSLDTVNGITLLLLKAVQSDEPYINTCLIRCNIIEHSLRVIYQLSQSNLNSDQLDNIIVLLLQLVHCFLRILISRNIKNNGQQYEDIMHQVRMYKQTIDSAYARSEKSNHSELNDNISEVEERVSALENIK